MNITCKNCGQIFKGHFCNNCGQASETHKINAHFCGMIFNTDYYILMQEFHIP